MAACEVCGAKVERALKCSRCGKGSFCEKDCFRAAWKTHKSQCKVDLKPGETVLPEMEGMQIKETGYGGLGLFCVKKVEQAGVVLGCEKPALIKKKEDMSHVAYGMSVRDIDDGKSLEKQFNKLPPAVQKQVLSLHNKFPGFLGMDRNDVRNVEPIFEGNKMTITEDMVGVASALYPFFSRLNHSCVPNCMCIFCGNELFVKSVRSIEPGEELTIAYCQVLKPKHERQAGLSDDYDFLCTCKQCKTETPEESFALKTFDEYRNTMGRSFSALSTKQGQQMCVQSGFQALKVWKENSWSEKFDFEPNYGNLCAYYANLAHKFPQFIPSKKLVPIREAAKDALRIYEFYEVLDTRAQGLQQLA